MAAVVSSDTARNTAADNGGEQDGAQNLDSLDEEDADQEGDGDQDGNEDENGENGVLLLRVHYPCMAELRSPCTIATRDGSQSSRMNVTVMDSRL